MFRNKIKRQIKIQIETQINDLKLYLENNYKDLAIEARKEAISLIEEYYKKGNLKEKDYMKYQKILGEYTELMKDYNHQQFYRT